MATSFSFTTYIEAMPSTVWRVLSDFSEWHSWTDSITSIDALGAGPPGVGSEFAINQPKLGPATWTITSWTEGEEFSWVSRSPGVRTVARHTITPSGAGCELELDLRFHGLLSRLVGWIAGNLTEKYLRMEASGLKARCEGLGRRH